jgi:enediyne biosynthesis protein E4
LYQPFAISIVQTKTYSYGMGYKKIAPVYLSTALLLVTIMACNKKNNNTLFERQPASQTNISFTNKLEDKKLFNILYYLYFYNGGGVATGDINNDGLPDIYFTANSKGNNKLYLNKGNFVFEDITKTAGVDGTADWCTGVTMADINGDGYLDIYVSSVSNTHGLKGHNQLYINNGGTAISFTEKATEYGLAFSGFTTQTAFFDYDKDGDLDCYILNQSHHPHANIADTGKRRTTDSLSGDKLYRNDMNTAAKKFTDVTGSTGIYQSNLGYGLGLAVADINNDGWDDIYIGNDFHENDYYYINNKNGTFTESGAAHFGHYSRFSMGNDVADYNNDGQLDIVTVDMLPPNEKTLKTYGSDENPDIYKVKLEIQGYQKQYSKNCLQRNNGNGSSFSETSLQSGVSATDWSWSALFNDFDNDGNKDLFITSGIVKRPVDLDYIRFVSDMQKNKGMDMTDKYDEEVIAAMPDGASQPWLFKGDGKLYFKDVSKAWGTADMKGYFNGAAYADLDNDGNLDLVMNCINAPAVILKNKGEKKNFISLAFKGDSMNRNGVGAKAYVYTTGKMQYQQLMPTRGFMSSQELRLHFGLDTATVIDSVVIVWPNQQKQVMIQPKINSFITVQNKEAVFAAGEQVKQAPGFFTDVSSQVTCNWQHKENEFLDYNVQYLIPHELSTRGPKMAVADINNDGLDDFYVCGAKGQPGALMQQQPDGNFKAIDTGVFNPHAICEEVDAVFFDANGDKFPDLFVISGGNEIPVNALSLLDKLYLNDGKGHFKQVPDPMSVVYENKSCVTVADIEHDGDMDIFIGNLAKPTVYGAPVTSYLFLNDGKGHFTKAGENIIPLFELGMVTAASFSDMDKDGWADLVVTGEWMAVKYFRNNKGIFTRTDIPASTGLWQSLSIADVNNDGYNDILAGNWGHNSKLYAGKNGPLKLYVKDFDKNGASEPVMCYTINNKEYTFLAKDELERVLPVLKKAYLTYGEVAGKPVQYMLYDLFKDYRELKAEVLSSSCFINDGKGNFSRVNLPDEAQLAPVFSFAPLPSNGMANYLAGGNFYGVIPYEGRYDALLPTAFSFDNNKKVFNTAFTVNGIEGEVRDLKWINRAGGEKILVVARNNRKLVFLKERN